ncbi:hypothetical protein N9L68_00070 [bacterium]|nr:hypothetical protein [bacterium]
MLNRIWCSRRVHVCSKCVIRCSAPGPRCLIRWIKAGRRCVYCGVQAAQTELKDWRSCPRCVSNIDAESAYSLVREESDRYLQIIAVQNSWDGTEPALRMLWLPNVDGPALPSHASTPELLDLAHCRL